MTSPRVYESFYGPDDDFDPEPSRPVRSGSRSLALAQIPQPALRFRQHYTCTHQPSAPRWRNKTATAPFVQTSHRTPCPMPRSRSDVLCGICPISQQTSSSSTAHSRRLEPEISVLGEDPERVCRTGVGAEGAWTYRIPQLPATWIHVSSGNGEGDARGACAGCP